MYYVLHFLMFEHMLRKHGNHPISSLVQGKSENIIKDENSSYHICRHDDGNDTGGAAVSLGTAVPVGVGQKDKTVMLAEWGC